MTPDKKFWAEESREKSHKDIKGALEKKAGIKKPSKAKKAKDPKKKVTKGKAKIEKVMHEFKEKTLHAGSKKGPKVTNPKQAIAIALSEARKKGAKIPKKKK